MRKHEGDTRVCKHSRMERFLPPDHATEQAIVQIGHRRFLQLANCFSKLFSKLACCLASGSGTGVGQLLRFVAGQIQDRAEVSHLRGGVRLAGASSFCKLLFRSARSFERCPARNRVVFINSGKGCGKRGPLPESRGTADLTLCLRSLADAKYEERETPSKGPLLMKTSRFLAGLPSFSATEVRGRVPLAQTSARKRAERRVRLGGHVGRTRCPALRRIRHRRARPCPHKPDSHVRGNSSSNAAKDSG